MNNLLNKTEALRAALEQAGLESANVRMLSCRLNGTCYEIELRSDWMRYECYVGCVSGELRGFNYEPSVDVEAIDGVRCDQILGGNVQFAA